MGVRLRRYWHDLLFFGILFIICSIGLLKAELLKWGATMTALDILIGVLMMVYLSVCIVKRDTKP